jgi:ubiquinone/menaquinone biosynthesis C-methylase UbiE
MKAVTPEVWQRAQSGHYETWLGHEHRPIAERRAIWAPTLDAVADRRPFLPGERVLDVGCGLETLVDLIDGAKAYTLDSLMAKLVPLGLVPGARHSAGLLERVPFRDASFDRVFLLNVLDHVLAPEAGLRELARVLRPGGQLVLTVDTYHGRRYATKRLHKWWARTRGARTKHPWVFSPESVARMLVRAGLEPSPPGHIPGQKERRTFFTALKPG